MSDLKDKQSFGTFCEKRIAKTNQKEFRNEKVIKKKNVINYMLNGNTMIIILTVGLIKKTQMREYFLELKSSEGRVKVELDLPNYATEADLKNATGFAYIEIIKTRINSKLYQVI